MAHGTTSHAPQDYVAPPNLTRRVTVKAVDIRFFDGKSLPDPAKYRDAKSLPRIFRPSDAKVPETDIPETTGIKRVDPTPIFRQRTDIPDIITAENIKSKSVNWILKPATASLTDTGHIDSESLIDNAATTNPDDWAELDTKETSLPKTKKVGRSWAGATTARRRFVDQTQESTAWAPGSEQYDDCMYSPSCDG